MGDDSHTSGRAASLHPMLLAVAGGISGVVAKLSTAPMGRLTILYQVQAVPRQTGSNQPLGLAAAMRHVVHQEGVLSLWKGSLATLLHRLPYSAVNFVTYEVADRTLQPHMRHDVSRRLLAGGLAGAAGCIVAYPLDLLRTRLAANTSPHRPGLMATAADIVRQQGFAGLYAGLGPTVMQTVPSLALHFMFYNTFKQQLLEWGSAVASSSPAGGGGNGVGSTAAGAGTVSSTLHQDASSSGSIGGELSCKTSSLGSSDESSSSLLLTVKQAFLSPTALSLVAATGSSLCTSTICYPLDKIRRVIQVQGTAPGPATAVRTGATAAAAGHAQAAVAALAWPPAASGPGSSSSSLAGSWHVQQQAPSSRGLLLHTAQSIYASGGLGAFYRGIAAEYLKVVPGIVIAFLSYDMLKQKMAGVDQS